MEEDPEGERWSIHSKQYLERGEKLNGFSVLLHRVRGAKQLREDAQLLFKLKESN